MIDIFVLDKNLNRINIIDSYKSLIWANRYNELGDCELQISASVKNLKIFQDGIYLAREDDDMVCRIEDIEINTDSENGDFLIITGYDSKNILAQRVIWNQTNFNGLVEDYIRKLINENVINPKISKRKINNFILDKKAGFKERIKQQVTYDNLNEKVKDLCKKYNWGYEVYTDYNNFIFKLYKGEDRSSTVIFSDNFENLSSSKYKENKTNIVNAVLIAGEGEGVNRITTNIGQASGIDRYETFIDARDVSKSIDYDELIKSYPGGEEVTIEDLTYYQVDGVNIATLTKEEESTEVVLCDDIYNDILASKCQEGIVDAEKSFEGVIIPNLTFKYKKDYFLGDIVMVENKYGILLEARITEVIEVCDENGYNIEPKYEFLEEIQ